MPNYEQYPCIFRHCIKFHRTENTHQVAAVQTKGTGSLISGALGHSWGANRAIPYTVNIHDKLSKPIT